MANVSVLQRPVLRLRSSAVFRVMDVAAPLTVVNVRQITTALMGSASVIQNTAANSGLSAALIMTAAAAKIFAASALPVIDVRMVNASVCL